MAGSRPGFSKARFNAGITAAMNMAAPLALGDRATFYFAPVTSPVTAADGVPFNPATTPSRTTKTAVSVACVAEQASSSEEFTRFGPMTTSKIRVTLLEDQYQAVKGCAFVVVAGDKFDYVSTEAPAGLFDAQVWTLWFITSQDT